MSALHGLRVDTLVTGTDGVTLDAGFTTRDVLESGLFERMADIADRVVVVADSSKIGTKNLQVQLPINRVDVLVTDSDAPEDFLDGLRDIDVEVVVVSAEPGY
jgi:DeoR family transcriptional regulator of aga operon